MATMTLQQQAYNRINQLSDEGLKIFLEWFEKTEKSNGFTMAEFTCNVSNDEEIEANSTDVLRAGEVAKVGESVKVVKTENVAAPAKRVFGSMADKFTFISPDFDTCFDDDPAACGLEELV